MFNHFSQKNSFYQFPEKNFSRTQGVSRYGVSECVLHLKAEDLSHLSNLAPVSNWKDSISNYEFIQNTSGNQPRFITSNPSYNNFPVVNFQDGSRRMISQITAAFNLATFVIIGNYEALIGTDSCAIGHSSVNCQIGFGGNSAGVTGTYILANGSLIYSGNTENFFPKIAAITNSSITVNGVIENTRTDNQINFIINQLGAVLASSNPFVGNIAEFLVFNKQLKTNEISKLMIELNTKYSLY